MRTKLIAICFATVCLGSFAVSEASAREITAAVTTLPSTVRVNAIEVSVNTGSRHSYRHGSRHRSSRYHRVRRVSYRHGHRVVRYVRVRY